MKKLYSDMTKDEIKCINNILEQIHIKEFSKHALTRMNEKGIQENDVLQVLHSYDVVEFFINNGRPRVLLRGRKVDKKGYNTCISISLSDGAIITSYKNNYKDNHKTLDKSNYINCLDIKSKLINIENKLKNTCKIN